MIASIHHLYANQAPNRPKGIQITINATGLIISNNNTPDRYQSATSTPMARPRPIVCLAMYLSKLGVAIYVLSQ